MNKITKQDIEKCVKDVIQQKHIPSEERLRIIIAEEIEKYYEKEEREGLEAKLTRYQKDNGLKNVIWYILMWVYLPISMSVIRMFSIYTETFLNNLGAIELYHVLLLALFLAIMCLLAVGFVKLYDLLIKRENKVAKTIIFILIIYWLDIIWADAIPWVERIFGL